MLPEIQDYFLVEEASEDPWFPDENESFLAVQPDIG